MFNSRILKNKIAFKSENFKISYAEFYKKISENKKLFNFKKKTFFLLAENSYEFINIYVSLIRSNHVIFLLDSKITKENLFKLINKFKPNFILYSKDNNFRELLKFEIFHEFETFKLICTNKEDVILNKELLILLPTSGSTGSPKFVMLSKSNIKKNNIDVVKYLKLNSNSKTILKLPLNYSFGLSILHTHLMAGSTIYLTQENIISKNFWKFFNLNKINTFYGVPQTFDILKKLNFNPKHKMKFLAVAGGKLDDYVIDHFLINSKKNKYIFYNMYGQTEASPRISFSSSENKNQSIYSVGKSFGGSKILIKKENNNYFENNKIGKIFYKGKNVMLGYAKNINDLNNKRKNNHELITGDYGYFNDDNDLMIVGRIDKFTKINGIRINLDDIEVFIRNKFDIKNKCICNKNIVYVFLETKKKPNILLHLKVKFNLRKNDFRFIHLNKFKRLNNGKIDLLNLKKIINN